MALEILEKFGPQVAALDGTDAGAVAVWIKNVRAKAQSLDPVHSAAVPATATMAVDDDADAKEEAAAKEEATTQQGKRKRIELALLAHGVVVKEGDVEAMELHIEELAKRQRA